MTMEEQIVATLREMRSDIGTMQRDLGTLRLDTAVLKERSTRMEDNVNLILKRTITGNGEPSHSEQLLLHGASLDAHKSLLGQHARLIDQNATAIRHLKTNPAVADRKSRYMLLGSVISSALALIGVIVDAVASAGKP